MSSANIPNKYDTFELADKAERSSQRTVRKLYEERAAQNETVSIWRDGKVMILPARDLLRELDANAENLH